LSQGHREPRRLRPGRSGGNWAGRIPRADQRARTPADGSGLRAHQHRRSHRCASAATEVGKPPLRVAGREQGEKPSTSQARPNARTVPRPPGAPAHRPRRAPPTVVGANWCWSAGSDARVPRGGGRRARSTTDSVMRRARYLLAVEENVRAWMARRSGNAMVRGGHDVALPGTTGVHRH